MSGYKIVLKQIKLPKLDISFCIFYMITSGFLGLIFPVYSGKVFDSILSRGMHSSGIKLFVIFGIGYLIFSTLYNMKANKIGNLMYIQLLKKLTEELLVSKHSFFLLEEDGSILSRFSNDVGVLNEFFSTTIPNFLISSISIFCSAVMLMIIDWQLTLFMFTSVLFVMLLLLPLGKIQSSFSQKIQYQKSNYLTQLNKIIKGIKTIKLFHSESVELNQSSKILDDYYYLQIKQSYLDSILQPIFIIILFGCATLIGLVGYYHYKVGILSKSMLLTFILYIFYMIPNILKCLQFFIEFSKSKVSTKRISDILSSPKERISGERVSANNDIVFKNVSVDIDCKKILDNINFKIEKGSTTAIVGTSGSGKSTLLNLLAGFDEKYKGEILIGNKELQTIRLDDWREDIGVVLQDSFLIGDSIKDIIEYSGNKLSDSQIKSYLDELIVNIDINIRKSINSNGTLSGGQKQKLDILRNFVKQPKILILDEATANLDSYSELKVLNMLGRMKECTKIIVAHRLSSVKNADNIIFLENGKITGKGTHQELLRFHEGYRVMYQNQLLGG